MKREPYNVLAKAVAILLICSIVFTAAVSFKTILFQTNVLYYSDQQLEVILVNWYIDTVLFVHIVLFNYLELHLMMWNIHEIN